MQCDTNEITNSIFRTADRFAIEFEELHSKFLKLIDDSTAIVQRRLLVSQYANKLVTMALEQHHRLIKLAADLEDPTPIVKTEELPEENSSTTKE